MSAVGTPARLVLAGVAANLAVGTLFGWSLLAQEAADDVGMSDRGAAAVFATAVAVFSAVLLALGPLQRRAGPRRLLAAAAVLAAAGLLVAASARSPLLLWGGVAVLFGTANGLGYGVAVGLPARVPARRRGAATGLVVAAYAVTPVLLGFVAPPALAAAGWRTCLAVLALPVTALLAAAARLLPPDSGPPPGREEPAPVPRRTVVLLWVVFAAGTAPGLALFAQAVPLAADRRLGPAAAGIALAALAVGNLTGRLVAGWWSDRVGRRVALATALATGAAAVACLAGPTAAVVVLAGFLGSGLAYGAVSALVPAATADRVGAAAFPSAYGRVFTGWGTAGLVAPLAGERLLRSAEGSPALLLLAAVPFAVAALAVGLLTADSARAQR
ncbi:MFS transporter [Geodermatophilus sp. SYSU D00691]